MEEEIKEMENDFTKILNRRTRKLSKEELKKEIIKFIGENKICTIATCLNNIPRSTPVRYRSKDMTIYVLTEGGVKIKNIMENPNVSVSLYGDYSGFESVKGLQLWGRAEIIKPEDEEKYAEARSIIKSEEREDLKKLGVKASPDMKIIKIEATRARYLNFPDGILNQVWEV
ncbi:MAG: hypothetical protein A3C43_01085 [Candidatus Schekmanbacteria bacterium RIFCSPHIGHO2_02_FULL_38_11]|uniref:Pyridoxamine 5'-phosphate oxidase N-terminal domain-containing protein n=1 Tax=Candidatus Schekmanbacteria bacterium RIFCSPLOWO2_12_FULL_38_15 TaxID=1817883 RepID=A0A1F7SEA3_9BACT|nr:MAG: hypothetical protein A2043_07425 [Candidatus Schekmanbacteria bacterium GWA2_38_9]OGL49137.1 MAG: hypothetical protein A3H37_04170 [Candidatus Schekmanbacteria bacterium RIFCSPLOWO2_02_FULL_38_14]OGL51609.1 MAG: hypothetical protein A3C43_01085 [Candidatus Schekmanbacteria bacterium RIFCSPHIGHO2_02_FULL_38_11]OGL52113.1 MAG: hypothetical protein A3G31_06755 [Candidatus Schekmanbacteria bacterium RIFCSPLOWO2_12_FULL_38_15]